MIKQRFSFLLFTAAVLTAMVVSVAATHADDRDLFRASAADPYIFILFDTSGSMHWDQQGDGLVASADDPSSRLYQAKSALYQVLRGLDDGARIGWAHFSQDSLYAYRKHWTYKPKARATNPVWFDTVPYPAVGVPEIFGRNYYTFGALPEQFSYCGAYPNGGFFGWSYDAAIGLEHALYHPKLGDELDVPTSAYIQHDGVMYKFEWQLVGGSLGSNEITVRTKVYSVAATYPDTTAGRPDPRTANCTLTSLGEADIVYEPSVAVDQDGVAIRDRNGALPNDFIARTERSRLPGNRTLDIYGLTTDSTCPSGNSVSSWGPLWHPNNTTSTGFLDSGDDSQLQYPNFDVPSARYGGTPCSAAAKALTRGSVLPWDWVQHPTPSPQPGFATSTKEELMCRLAPNTCSPDPNDYHVVTGADKDAGLYSEFDVGDRVPDFRVGRYFEDEIDGSSNRLVLRDRFQNYPPIAAFDATPLAGMMRELDDWLEYWLPCAADPASGDRNLPCRERYAIVLTDGAETCEDGTDSDGRLSAIRSAANDLRASGVRTFAVGFGDSVDVGGLQDIADFGGTGTLDLAVGTSSETEPGDGETDCRLQYPVDPSNPTPCTGPILAANKQDLVDALNRIFAATASQSTSFASAAVPAGQADAQDSIFLTNFVPLDGTSEWAGEMSHYLRPLPLKTVSTPDGDIQIPDDSIRCGPNRQFSCLAWKAGEAMLGLGGAFDQVPSFNRLTEISDFPTLIDNSTLQLGNGTNRRRVYYGLGMERQNDLVGYNPSFLSPTVSGTRLTTLIVDSGLVDLDTLLPFTLPTLFNDVLDDVQDALDDSPSLLDQLVKLLGRTLLLNYNERVVENPFDEGPDELRYILGDTFHSDPQQLGDPTNVAYLQGNLPVGSTDDCDDLTSTSYRCFFLRNQYRRKVVFTGSNDGQLHAFDAGLFKSKVVDSRQVGEFDLGSGQELFAFVPNALISRLMDRPLDPNHEYALDGELRIADVFIDPKHTGSPNPSERMWRTVVMGGLREGGETVERLGGTSSYYALDVTQPDKLKKEPNLTIAEGGEWVPDHPNYVPSCIAAYNETDCGPLRYGAVLWEFSDLDPNDNLRPADDDNNGEIDLAPTWSRPTIGRVQVEKTNGDVEDRFAAIFGGGFDPDNPLTRGNWLYVLDMETGKILAKRQLDGAAPSSPAAVDTDGDGYLDTVYIGTYAGSMYKMSLAEPGELRSSGRVRNEDWKAFRVFLAGANYPMFTPPSVIFVPSEDRYALAFGVGNRADLWDQSFKDVPGRFYTLLDTGWKNESGFSAFTESDFEVFSATDTTDRSNLLKNPASGKEPGWIVTLQNGEKLVSRPFTLAGVTIFSTYKPLPLQVVQGNVACERDGETNIFTVFTTSGNALVSDRFRSVPGIVSNPFTEVSSLQGRGLGGGGGSSGGGGDGGGGDGGGTGGGIGGPTADDLTEDLEDIRESIMELFPEGCRFNEVSVNLKVVRSDTGIEFIAPVPVCVQATNWKDIP